MLDHHAHAHPHFHVIRQNARRKDPTRTTGLRTSFEREINRRFAKLKKLVRTAIVDEDIFGLKTNAFLDTTKFTFATNPEKIQSFLDWLKEEEDETIFSIKPGTPIRSAAQQVWSNVYIESAYQKGLSQAAMNLRAQGVEVSDHWIDSAFFRPIHADRVGIIYTRSYNDLAGITDAMDTSISRILAEGIAEGRNPIDIARDLSAAIDGIGRTRARTLARTEVINAHATASLNAYREAGLEGVKVQAEWSTAGDDAVCPDCEDMEGKTFSIEEADGLIPLHPNCRCAWLPVVDDPDRLALN